MAEKVSYEKAREELTKVVEQLEAGSATLEDSLKLWERGEALAAKCEEWLSGARKRLDDAIVNLKIFNKISIVPPLLVNHAVAVQAHALPVSFRNSHTFAVKSSGR
mgnify:CR=1 FL=1